MGYTIKTKREELHLTQEELAKRSGVTRVTIARLESEAQTDLKVSNLKRIAEALECKVSDLLCD